MAATGWLSSVIFSILYSTTHFGWFKMSLRIVVILLWILVGQLFVETWLNINKERF